MFSVISCFLGIYSTAAITVLSKYGNQNEQDCNIYKHVRVSKSYRVIISYSIRGEALSQYLPPPRWKLIAAQRSCFSSFLFFIPVISHKTSLHIASTQISDIAWYTGLTHPRHHNVSSVYLGVWNGWPHCTTLCGGTQNIRCRWVEFFLPSLNPVQEVLLGTGQNGGPALKVGRYIFGNKEMYHLCVH